MDGEPLWTVRTGGFAPAASVEFVGAQPHQMLLPSGLRHVRGNWKPS